MSVNITWITQGRFIIEYGGKRLIIDPYLSDYVERAINLTHIVHASVALSGYEEGMKHA